jgi:hypothetical protein
MDYDKSENFRGNPDKAIECARNIFMGLSFRVTSNGRSELLVENTTTVMNNKQNPLLFISQATISVAGSNIAIQADFGAVRRFIKFMTLLFVALSVPSAIVTGAVLYSVGESLLLGVGIGLSIIMPLPIILPIIAISMRASANKALDALMHNLIDAAR